MEAAYRSGTVLLGKYRIEGVIGRGGMGIVLGATHLVQGDNLAIKILSPEAAAHPQVHARFRWEAQSVVRLRGEHVARVSDVGLLPEGAPYMVMEYLRGQDLARELERRGALAPGEAVDYVMQACEALAEGHAIGVVHRNVKPGNLFLTTRPDGAPLLKVLDFGIPTRDAIARPNAALGMRGYLAPEQMAGEAVDPRTDIWALGIVLYECLTGHRPFKAKAGQAIEPPQPMDPRIPAGLQAAVLRCLEPDRNARFPTIGALAVALAPFAQDQRAAAVIVERIERLARGGGVGPEPVVQAPPPVATRAREWIDARRRQLMMGLLGAMVVVVGALAAIVLLHEPEQEAPEVARAPVRPVVPPAAPKPVAPVVDRGEDRVQRLAVCKELQAQRKWQALEECAGALEAAGGGEPAKEFRATASQEMLNEAEDAKVRKALADGDLKAAETSLQLITADSVYFASLDAAFGKAEARVIEEVRKNAQGMARDGDCGGLRKLVAKLTETSSERVTAAATGVRCGREPEVVAARETPRETAKETAREPRDPARETAKEPARDSREAAREPARDSREAARETPKETARETPKETAREGAREPAAAPVREVATAAPAPRETPAAPAKGCDKINSDDLMIQAATHYDGGRAKQALSLATVALHCKQTPRMYWLAVLYACAAHDLANAKLYFREVPANLQAGIERKCQQESLDVRSR